MVAKPNSCFAAAPSLVVPGVTSMVGFRSLGGVSRGLPSPELTLIVSLDDGIQIDNVPSAAKPIPVLLAGLRLQSGLVRKVSGQGVVQLSVHPLASRALFGVPAAELNADTLDIMSSLGLLASRLHEQVAEAKHWQAAFTRVAQNLQAARRAAPVRPEVAFAWRLLARSRGRTPVESVARQVGMSPRHLATLFRREVGHTPKTVAMLMRFEYATRRIAGEGRRGGPVNPVRIASEPPRSGLVDLARIAVEAGYADQAHLTREFVRFAGVSPTSWLANDFRNLQDSLRAYPPGCTHGDHDL